MDLPEPERRPPHGVPRWLWPPPGAVVRRVLLREEVASGGALQHVVGSETPEPPHLRALQWLLGEFPREEVSPESPAVADVLLEIARTELGHGRVGHAYAINGQALGAPRNAGARGVVWRYALSVLGRAPDSFDTFNEDDF